MYISSVDMLLWKRFSLSLHFEESPIVKVYINQFVLLFTYRVLRSLNDVMYLCDVIYLPIRREADLNLSHIFSLLFPYFFVCSQYCVHSCYFVFSNLELMLDQVVVPLSFNCCVLKCLLHDRILLNIGCNMNGIRNTWPTIL